MCIDKLQNKTYQTLPPKSPSSKSASSLPDWYVHCHAQELILTHSHSFSRKCRLLLSYFWKYLLNKAKIHKIFEGEFLSGLWSTFLLQMFSRKCVCKLHISKIVRPLLAALSVNGLTLTMLRLLSSKAQWCK